MIKQPERYIDQEKNMFDIEKFRKKIDSLYKKGDIAAIDKYFDQSKEEIKKEIRVLSVKLQKSGDDRLNTEDRIKFVLLNSEAEEILNSATGFYRSVNNWDKCFDTFDELFALIKKSGEEGTVGHADVLVNFATALRIMGNIGLAETNFKKAEDIYNKNKYEDPNHRAALYNNRAPLYLERMEFDKAIEDLQKAMFYLKKIPDAKRERAMTLTGLANAYISKGDLKSAEDDTDIAIALFEDLGGDVFYGSALNTKAQIVYMNGDYENAAELFSKAAEVTKKYFGENEDFRICRHNHEICAELAKRQKEEEEGSGSGEDGE